jgi:hypothetical protein
LSKAAQVSCTTSAGNKKCAATSATTLAHLDFFFSEWRFSLNVFGFCGADICDSRSLLVSNRNRSFFGGLLLLLRFLRWGFLLKAHIRLLTFSNSKA